MVNITHKKDKKKKKKGKKNKNVEKHVGKGKVTITKTDGAATMEEIKVMEFESDTPVCNVGMSLGATMNIGNYEAMKIQVSIHIPCHAKDIEPVFGFARDWCGEKLETVGKQLKEEVGL